MPAYKRSRSGTRVSRPRKTYRSLRKRYTKRRMVRTKRGRVSPSYKFHRWVTALTSGVNVTNCTYDTAVSVIGANASVSTSSFSFSFALSDIPSLGEFTNLFDSYMITGVMLQLKLVSNPDGAYPLNATTSSVTVNNANWFPTVWYVPDHDDNSTLTLAQIKEFEKARHKVLYPNRETNIMLRPTTLQQLYRSSTTTGYANNMRRSWLDMAQTDIPHYGCKFVVDFEGQDLQATANQFRIKVNAKFYFRCKSVR